MKYVIRDRELRCSLLKRKRKRKGKRSRVDRVAYWMAPLGVFEDVVVSFMGPGILFLTLSDEISAPQSLTVAALCLSVLLILSLVSMHAVRVAHSFGLLRRGTLIVDDLFGGLVFLAFWACIASGFALTYFWQMLYWLVWR